MEQRNKTFGDWLREQRLDRGMTIGQFAEVCRLSYVTLSNIERDKYKAGIYATKQIANALNMHYIDLRNVIKERELNDGNH